MAVDMDSVSNITSTPRGAPSPGRPKIKVLCVVSSEERRLFLSHASGLLHQLPATIDWVATDGPEGVITRVRETNPDILITSWSTPPLPEEWIVSPACALRYICHLAGSVRWLVPRRFLEQGGIVTNWGDLPSGAVAEHALLLALAALRNSSAWQDVVRHAEEAGSHIERLQTRTLFGRRVAIHGFGRVARALVALLKPFAVTIHAYSAGVPDELMRAMGVVPVGSLKALAASSDVFFECEALTPGTTATVSATVLAALPTQAVFVNVGRGGVVDEAALLKEARSARIRVALDVFISEPLVPNSAFCGVPGAVLSPHIAGPTFDQYPQCGELAARNLGRYLRHEPLVGRLTLDEYDRAT